MRAEGECQAFLAPAPEVHAAPGTEFEDFGTKNENRRAVRSMEAAIVVEAVVVDAATVVEGADANGVVDEQAVRGDV